MIQLNKVFSTVDTTINTITKIYIGITIAQVVAKVMLVWLKALQAQKAMTIRLLAFSSNGLLASARENRNVHIQNLDTGRQISVFNCKGRLRSMTFDPSGTILVLVYRNGSVCVHEVKSGHEVLQLDFGCRVKSFSFSHDWKHLAVALEGGGLVVHTTQSFA